MHKYILNLQLFADGGDGGDGGEATAEGVSSGDPILDSIPERAKKFYKPSTPKAQPKEEVQEEGTTTSEQSESKMSYADLIKSDDYKADHEAYMEKTIGNRLKKYKGVEESNAKMKKVLENVSAKYGIDASSESFLEDLASAVEADDSYYEKYAVEHDVTPQEARKIVTMERKVTELENQRAEEARQEELRQQIAVIQNNAQKTKAMFPQFDLDVEMQNTQFARLVGATQGDTTAAYKTLHWDELFNNAVGQATEVAKQQTANAIASNKSRPIENGMSSNAPAVMTTNFSGMNLEQLRGWAEEQRRKQN